MLLRRLVRDERLRAGGRWWRAELTSVRHRQVWREVVLIWVECHRAVPVEWRRRRSLVEERCPLSRSSEDRLLLRPDRTRAGRTN